MNFKVGDRVKITGNNMDELVEWCADTKVNSTGVVEKNNGGDYSVLSDDDNLVWFIPKECLEIIEDAEEYPQEHTKLHTIITSLDRIKTFTMNHKNLEIAFEDGYILMRDFTPSFEHEEYKCDTIEQLEELMGAWESVCKFKVESES